MIAFNKMILNNNLELFILKIRLDDSIKTVWFSLVGSVGNFRTHYQFRFGMSN